ncbi:3',5'-cyclic-AMP phosphodiesterase [Marinobacter orientalis]|uniref:3',5'-cyclic-AMP phosphodiesterase n=1 Tax=Marinobacter orientalis TaxID=1928859 RepID=A0A7Y0RFH3_9GAMM|nr:3',5'-cyclic-AMP phosphodiesterase [Marinobacter orientalis]NMT65280.1 3',5'-cyclic-AMP phosphodiesterase [Marinobacter orientalis]TGX47948.1 3',5'-cyclic-AMP phosphodiesterase [Marinobacter orientalis]
MTENDSPHALRVLQLTDPHLMADPGAELLGINTRESLDAVIAQVLHDRGQPDLILVTGDIAQDATEEAYRLFGNKLEAFHCPSAWIAGNHDDSPLLALIAAERKADLRHVIQGGWQFVLLDTSVPGKVFGQLADSELAFLEKTLRENPETPALVALHHHPVEIDTDWMSPIGLRNRDAFWQVVDRFPQVRIVLWGHIHQDLEQSRKGVCLLATPSTCIQFTAGSTEFSVEDKAPGYRWFELLPSGEFFTEVSRAEDFVFDLDSNSSGY